jgi:hypothetical protein
MSSWDLNAGWKDGFDQATAPLKESLKTQDAFETLQRAAERQDAFIAQEEDRARTADQLYAERTDRLDVLDATQAERIAANKAELDYKSWLNGQRLDLGNQRRQSADAFAATPETLFEHTSDGLKERPLTLLERYDAAAKQPGLPPLAREDLRLKAQMQAQAEILNIHASDPDTALKMAVSRGLVRPGYSMVTANVAGDDGNPQRIVIKPDGTQMTLGADAATAFVHDLVKGGDALLQSRREELRAKQLREIAAERRKTEIAVAQKRLSGVIYTNNTKVALAAINDRDLGNTNRTNSAGGILGADPFSSSAAAPGQPATPASLYGRGTDAVGDVPLTFAMPGTPSSQPAPLASYGPLNDGTLTFGDRTGVSASVDSSISEPQTNLSRLKAAADEAEIAANKAMAIFSAEIARSDVTRGRSQDPAAYRAAAAVSAAATQKHLAAKKLYSDAVREAAAAAALAKKQQSLYY